MSSKKPPETLYVNFRQTFPEVCIPTSQVGVGPPQVSLANGLPDNLPDSLPEPQGNQFQSDRHLTDQDQTPGLTKESWMFMSASPDSNYPPFSMLAEQLPGTFMPSMEWNYTLPEDDVECRSIEAVQRTPTDAQYPHQSYSLEQDTCYESWKEDPFYYQPWSIESLDALGLEPLVGKSYINTYNVSNIGPSDMFTSIPGALPISSETFRFHVTLIAPTAMMEKADGTPVTYLNKGNAYSVSIIDTAPATPGPEPAQYRTSIRVSFDDGEHGESSAARWQLWKEGRGTTQAHQRGVEVQGIEYMETEQTMEDSSQRDRVDLETASIDGFSVLWSQGSRNSADCVIAVRFNFLSTDFSHSKGIQGLLSRFCVKTEVVSPDSTHDSEICFCKVKLFRDHGAERKLLNDITSVEKMIEKCRQKIAQLESRMMVPEGRKRGVPMAIEAIQSRKSSKISKERRTSSTSIPNLSEEDLRFQLQIMLQKRASRKSVSVLCIRGQEQDDPDLHPIHLTGGVLDVVKGEQEEHWQRSILGYRLSITGATSLISPSVSPDSPQFQNATSLASKDSEITSPSSRNQTSKYEQIAPTANERQHSNAQHLASPPNHPSPVQAVLQDITYTPVNAIEALEANPPLERLMKPVACFYVLYQEANNLAKREHYQAIYLMKREAKELLSRIAEKYDFEPTEILQMITINQNGLSVEVDDDVVLQLPEGRDMILELSRITVGLKWNQADGGNSCGKELTSTQRLIQCKGYLLKLVF